MNRATQKNERLRQYLLGKLSSETEKDSIEQSLMTDDDFFLEFETQEEFLIEDYAGGNLSAEDKKFFEENFLISRERREELKLVQALQRYANENKTTAKKQTEDDFNIKKKLPFFGNFFSAPIVAASFVIVLTIAAFVVWKISSQTVASNESLVALNKAYQKERPFDSRISGFDYAPANNLRGAGKNTTDEISRDRAQILSSDAVNQSRTAENLHALGRVYLAEKEFGKATETLQNAAQIAPQSAEIFNDLGITYLEQGKISTTDENGKSFELFAKSLEEFENALRLDPKLQTAQFNKALCLQALNQPHQAQEAWQNYLKLDDKSPWAEDARQNLQRLRLANSQSKTREEILHDFMTAFEQSDHEKSWQILSRNREMITGKLIPQQLAGLLLTSEKESQKKYLDALKYAGKIEKENSGDSYFAEVGEFYARLPKEKFTDLKFANDAVHQGYDFCLKNNYQMSLENFTAARKIFGKVGDEQEAHFADYWIAYANYQLTDAAQSTEILEGLDKYCLIKNYKWLDSVTLARLANNAGAREKHSETIAYNKKSLALAGEVSDLYLKQKTLSQLAEEYQTLGRHQEALKYLQESFRLLDYPETSSRQKWRTYILAAQSLFAQKYYSTAANLIREAINLNEREIKDDTFTFAGYFQLSQIYSVSGNFDEAFKIAEQSINVAENLADEKARSKAKAYTIFNFGWLQKEKGDCPNAVKNFNESIALSDETEFSAYNYKARESRLNCYAQLGDNQAVEAELPNVLKLFEENRAKITEEQNRNSFFDDGNDVYDLAVNYEVNREDYEKAFDYSEQSRARSLLDLQNTGGKIAFDESKPEIIFDRKITAPEQFKNIQAKLPDNVQIVEYSLLPDKTVAWLITKNSLKTFSTAVSSKSVEEKISAFSEAIKNKDDEKQNSLARELHTILIAPLENDLDRTQEICLIPDKALFNLPFAALISSQTNNFLFADYRLLTAPSASVFLISTTNAARRNKSATENILSVGDPTFDRQEFQDLADLPAAEDEAREISKFYEHSTLLLKTAATKEKLQNAISQADVFHFAGHYIPDEQSPLLSGFLVAGNKNNDKLTNYELLEGKLQKPKLIILSACQTGIESYYKGEGMIGAGRIFLAAGVPLVVGSQWEVDSDATQILMKNFHYYRKKERLSTVAALQRAQLAMLNSPNEKFRQPFYWAGFTVIGGEAAF